MRRAILVGGWTLIAVAGCSNDPATTRAENLPPNPSPLAHLTYDCAVLERASEANAVGPYLYFAPFDDGGSGQARMCAVGWDGKLRRQLDRGLATRQSADGSRLLAIDYPVVNSAPASYVIVDEANRILDHLNEIWNNEAIWADDSRHLCYIEDSNASGQNGLAYLDVRVPGEPVRRVATLGAIIYIPPAGSNGGGAPSPFIAGPRLLACSTSADRAVILNPSSGTISVLRLSDGTKVGAHEFGRPFYPYHDPAGSEQLVVSRDGRYVADNVEGAHSVPILDLLTGADAADLEAVRVGGFSWDGKVAAVQLSDHVVAITEWRSGRLVRQLTGSYPSVFARPDSPDLLVGMPSTRHEFGLDLYIIPGSGPAFEVARSVEVTGR